MKTNTIFLSLIFFSLIVFSCKKDKTTEPDLCAQSWATTTQDELTNYSNAIMAYTQDPTVANCEAVRQAAQAYLNALEPYKDCAVLTGQQKTDWETALQEAKDEIANSSCE